MAKLMDSRDRPVRLDTFTQAYIEIALWSSIDEEGNPLDANYGPEDLAPETLAQIVEDCQAFQEAQAADLEDATQDGHDFWLTRNRHGAGFWDRGYGERGERLSIAARAYGERDLYVGDDGRLYV